MFLDALVATGIALLFAGLVYEALSRRRDSLRFPPLGRLVDVGGHRLHLFSKGTGGPTVVIEQGAGGPSLAWLRVQDEIAEFAQVCIYDRAGYFWSDAVAGPRSLEDRVKDLHTLLIEAGLFGPYVLAAHSYGGFLVRLFAREHASSVVGLVLVDTPHEHGYCQPEVLSFYARMMWLLRVMGALSRFGVPRLLNRLTMKPDPNLPRHVSAAISAGTARREYFAAARDDIASLQRAAAWLVKPESFGALIDLPVTVITHGQPFPGPFAVLERTWREGQEKLAALSSNGALVIAENSNHMIQNDQPEVVVAAVRDVIMRARQRTTQTRTEPLAPEHPIPSRADQTN